MGGPQKDFTGASERSRAQTAEVALGGTKEKSNRRSGSRGLKSKKSTKTISSGGSLGVGKRDVNIGGKSTRPQASVRKKDRWGRG